MSSTYTSHYNLEKPDGNDDISVLAINGNFDKIDAAIWNTLTFRRTFTASDNLNAINNEGTGIYAIGNELPQNAPSGYTWSMVIQIKRTDIFIHQYIIKAEAGAILMREYSGSPQSWGNWKLVTGKTSKARINYGSNSYVEYWKNGNICQVYINYKVSDGTLEAWSSKTIATLPEGFRPYQETNVRAVLDRSNDDGTAAAVNSTGACVIQTRYNAFDATGDVIQANIVYPVMS